MKVINLFAGAGAGKSTTAAGLFYRMKKAGYLVELTTEYAKEKVYENNMMCMLDELYLLAKQNHKLERLKGKVDYVITDSPLLLCAYYGRAYGRHPEIVCPLAHALFQTYDNINFFITRTKPYSPVGRLGSEANALAADAAIFKMVKPKYGCLTVTDDDDILDNILENLKGL